MFLSKYFRARHITKIAIRPPEPIPGRGGLALVLIVRNEQCHIAEWAQFHLRAGVSHIYAYDNGSTDGTVNALLDAAGARVTVLPWSQLFSDARSGKEIHNQVLAYAHATRNFGGAYRWLSYLDVDEFLIPVHANDLPSALAPLEPHRYISLPWHMFGRNGHTEMPEGGVLQNYTRRAPDPMTDLTGVRNFKSIVDPCHVTALRVHEIEVSGRDLTTNDRGETVRLRDRTKPSFYSATRIQLNHYYTRSDSELRAKIERGPNLSTPSEAHQRRVWRKVDHIERNEIEDRLALTFLERTGQSACEPEEGHPHDT